MSGSAEPTKRGRGRPAAVGATEKWEMRVNPEWLARVKVKAKDWDVSVSQLIRVLVDQGLEGDMSVLYPPTEAETKDNRARRRREGPKGRP